MLFSSAPTQSSCGGIDEIDVASDAGESLGSPSVRRARSTSSCCETSLAEQLSWAAATSSDDDGSDRVLVKVSSLSGCQLAEVSLAPSRRVAVLKRQVQAACGVWADEQRLIFRDAVLSADRTLAASGITRDDALTMVHVPRPYVLGGQTDGSLTLWDLHTGDCIESLPRAHKHRVLSAAVDWPARQAMTTGNDRSLIFWDLARGLPVHIVEGLASSMQASAVDWQEQRVLGGFSDGSVFLFHHGEEPRAPMRVGSHQRCVTSVEVEWRSGRALTASYDRTAILWNFEDGEALCVLTGHQGVIMGVALGWPCGLAATGSADGTVALWALQGEHDDPRLVTMRGHSATVRSFAVDWARQRCLSASSDRTLGLWTFGQIESDDGAPEGHWRSEWVASLRGHHDEVNLVCADWSADMAISASSDRSLIVWDLATHQSLHILRIPGSAEVTALQVNWDAVDKDMHKAALLSPESE